MTHPLAPCFPLRPRCAPVCECVMWPCSELNEDQLGVLGGKSNSQGEKTDGGILYLEWMNKLEVMPHWGYQQRPTMLNCLIHSILSQRVEVFSVSFYPKNNCPCNWVWSKSVPVICLLDVCVGFHVHVSVFDSVIGCRACSVWVNLDLWIKSAARNPQQASCSAHQRQDERKEREKLKRPSSGGIICEVKECGTNDYMKTLIY